MTFTVSQFVFFPRSPEVESKDMRSQMLGEHRSVFGKARVFDGAVLYLPKPLEEKVRAWHRFDLDPF